MTDSFRPLNFLRTLKHSSNPETPYWFHTDHLGTPYVLTNSSKAVDWKISTDPFGETVTEQNPDDNNLRFPGQYLDRESGLNYNWHRFYQSKIGRYNETDLGSSPGLGQAEDFELANTFAYSNNNPLIYADRLGLWTNPTGGKIRGQDCCGSGEFTASRPKRKSKQHDAIDYVGVLGQPVLAPMSGNIEIKENGKFPKLTYALICGYVDAIYYCVKVVHITPRDIFRLGLGKFVGVKEGDIIGYVLDQRDADCPTITQHVHLELYRNGKQPAIDPTKFHGLEGR